MTKIESSLVSLMLGAAAFLAGAGCAPDQTAPGQGQAEDVTEVEVALSTVPTGVQCVRVAATIGSSTTTVLRTVMAGASSASIDIGQLGTGNATFNGAAFNLACASVTGSTVANWIAVPVMTTLSLGVSNKVTMTFLPNNPVTVNGNFLPAPVELSLGVDQSRVRMADGTIREWGHFLAFSLLQPAPVGGINDAVQVASGGSAMACARRATGGVSCWGIGSLWGSSGMTSAAVPITIATPINQISLGATYGCGMNIDAENCWGQNNSGQFGNGVIGGGGAPAPTGNLVARVAAGGSHTCVLDSAGQVFCAGANQFGQLGTGNNMQLTTPGPVVGLTGTVEVALGTLHSCALRGDGTVRCWGFNGSGQIGNGTTNQRPTPDQVVGITDAVHVVAGDQHTCVLRQMGTVSCWGRGTTLGDGLGQDRSLPGDVPGLSGVIALDSHLGNHTCAILSDRTVKCWGENGQAQVDGTLAWAGKPVTVVLQ